MSARHWWWIVNATLLLALLACAGEREEDVGEPTDFLDTVVQLDSAALAAAEVSFDSVRFIESSVLQATGTLTYDANAVAWLGPKTEGRIVRVVRDLGDAVEAGEPLAFLESQDVADVQAEAGRARAQADLAEQTYEREQSLYEQRVSSESEMLEARAAYQSAVADLRAAEAKVRTLGGLTTGAAGFAVSSPLAGTVVERDAFVGQIVDPEDQLFVVADLGHLWLIVDIYEKDLSKAAAGQRVEIRTQAFPDEAYQGRVAKLGLVVDPETHTVKTRVVVENPGRLRPGMFARAEITVPEPPQTLAVPSGAVQEIGNETVVFVPEGDGGFRAVAVEAGPSVGNDWIIIHSGLAHGRRIVAGGSFFLKSELLKASFGDVD